MLGTEVLVFEVLGSESVNSHEIFKRQAKALIRLCVCVGSSEPFAGRTYHIVGNLMSRLMLWAASFD